MSAPTFNRDRMNWLNRICEDSRIKHAPFRVAYLIADHLNSVTGYAWPSHDRIAEKLNISSKSIQRAVGQLERKGWLKVSRNRRRTNHYRISYPSDLTVGSIRTSRKRSDKPVPNSGHVCPNPQDSAVPQSSLTNLLRSSSRRLGEEEGRAFGNRGTYEQRIVERFGSDIWKLLGALNEIAPEIVEQLCRKEKLGILTQADIEQARLIAQVGTKWSNNAAQRGS